MRTISRYLGRKITGAFICSLSRVLAISLTVLGASLGPAFAQAQNAYVIHNLVSDLPGLADVTDTNLVNPWGIAFSSTSPFWISNNHSGLSTLYNTAGTPSALIVNIPPPNGGTPPGAPTGIIFNSTTSFTVASNAPARFIFSTEDGTIVGWSSSTNAILKADNSQAGSVYKGLAIAKSGNNTYLYATDFHNGRIDVFDTNYAAVTLTGNFSDPTIPAGFAPFGIEAVNGQLFVTYAKQDADAHDDVAGPGNGYVNVFGTDGQLVKRFASQGVLNSPWGMALAPAGFGPFAGALLIGNFGDGRVNAFDPNNNNSLLGTLTDAGTGVPLSVQGLWAIKFGNGGSGGEAHTLYFTAGIPGPGAVEDHGLFGSISAVFPAFTAVQDNGVAATLNWAGGQGPFLLQKRTTLSDTNWFDVLTTSSRSMMVGKDGPENFWRVSSQTEKTVLPFTVFLNGDSEVPSIATTASGIGTISIDGSNFNYNISFSGLSSPAIAAHLHGTADATTNAGVLFPLSGATGTSGTLSGTQVLTPDQLADIINGVTYVNIHTTLNQGGEVRGQVVPLHIPVTLNGASEVPAVTTSASGSASLTLVGNHLFYTLNFSGLVGNAIAAHIHGPAPVGSNAPVIVPFNTPPSAKSGSVSGTATLTPNQMAYLLSGQTYVNVHSTTNTGGEIRGQIAPAQFAVSMNAAAEVPSTASPGTGSGTLSVSNSVLFYNITFTNLLSSATGAHIHGPADTAHNNAVLIPFSPPAASSGTISGSASLSSQNLLYLVTGQTYANIHTTNYIGGEIRGQVLPNN
ncbi:MAG TPA: TIGR03118 family protein [Candidatus Limnocylindrales bacterium]|nr:TIGR03118 family protein [Candidatus Limnocylindrales bacterium]